MQGCSSIEHLAQLWPCCATACGCRHQRPHRWLRWRLSPSAGPTDATSLGVLPLPQGAPGRSRGGSTVARCCASCSRGSRVVDILHRQRLELPRPQDFHLKLLLPSTPPTLLMPPTLPMPPHLSHRLSRPLSTGACLSTPTSRAACHCEWHHKSHRGLVQPHVVRLRELLAASRCGSAARPPQRRPRLRGHEVARPQVKGHAA